MFEQFPPALILLIGALLTAISPGRLRPVFVLGAPLLTLYSIWQIADGVQLSASFLKYPIEVVEGSPVRRLFASVFALMALVGGLYSMGQAKRSQMTAALGYAAGAVGVAFAGDLITMFLCWEAMVLFSTIIVWCGGTDSARRAGIRYLILQAIGGIVLKIGIEGLMHATGSHDVRAISLDGLYSWLILIGVMINAAAPPLSVWLADAYPKATPSGTVILSAFTSKTAILALWMLFPGVDLLIYLGLYMAAYGTVYALLENDMRRLLAYVIVNQVGFMMTAIGIGTELALNGAAALAVAHIIAIGLLMMTAGSVEHMTGKRRLTELGGLYQSMPVTTLCAVIGALAIAAFPLTSGYLALSMVRSAAGAADLAWVWFLLTALAGAAVLHAGAKFPWFVFFHKDSGLRPEDPPWNMRAAMIIFAAASVLIGLVPGLFYQLLPFQTEHQAYAGAHVLGQAQLVLFGLLAFVLLLPLMKQSKSITLDWDWFWRVAGFHLARASVQLMSRWRASLEERWARHGASVRRRLLGDGDGKTGLARSWPSGSMVMWVAIILAVMLLAEFIG